MILLFFLVKEITKSYLPKKLQKKNKCLVNKKIVAKNIIFECTEKQS